jgi:hypothetical protein
MSIFSRLKKPPGAEPKSAVDPAAPGERDSHPAPAGAGEGAERRAAPPAKPNGVQPPVLKPASTSPAAPKSNVVADARGDGKADGKVATGTPGSNGATKRAELSRTMAYGVAPPAPRAPAAAPPAAAVPVPVQESSKGSIELAIDKALGAGPEALGAEPQAPGGERQTGVAHGASTAEDQAAVRATFEDLAVAYVADVRGVMMELQWGEVETRWLPWSGSSVRWPKSWRRASPRRRRRPRAKRCSPPTRPCAPVCLARSSWTASASGANR